MKRILSLFNYFMFSICSLYISHICAYEYDLAICAIFRDDAPYMREWIDFHQKQGVQKFYLYDNWSKDKPEIELKDYIKQGIVEILPWHKAHQTHLEWIAVQSSAYYHCVVHNRQKIKWLLILDTDEFCFCPNGKRLTKFLKGYEDKHQVAVALINYGTSHVEKAKKGKLIKELLFRMNFPKIIGVKCFVRPDYVIGCDSAHYFKVRYPSLSVNADNVLCYNQDMINPVYDKIRINHYFFRDIDFFRNVKLNRMIQQGRDITHLLNFENMCNEVFDDCILHVR